MLALVANAIFILFSVTYQRITPPAQAQTARGRQFLTAVVHLDHAGSSDAKARLAYQTHVKTPRTATRPAALKEALETSLPAGDWIMVGDPYDVAGHAERRRYCLQL